MEQSLHIKQLHLVQPLTLVQDALHISYSYSSTNKQSVQGLCCYRKRLKTTFTCISIKVYRHLENNLKETAYIDGYSARYR